MSLVSVIPDFTSLADIANPKQRARNPTAGPKNTLPKIPLERIPVLLITLRHRRDNKSSPDEPIFLGLSAIGQLLIIVITLAAMMLIMLGLKKHHEC